MEVTPRLTLQTATKELIFYTMKIRKSRTGRGNIKHYIEQEACRGTHQMTNQMTNKMTKSDDKSDDF